MCLRDAKRYDEAEEVLRQASEIMKKQDEGDLQVAVTLQSLGKAGRGEELLKRSPGRRYTLQSLGVCLRDAKPYNEAGELLREASGKKKQSWARTISSAVTLYELGVCLWCAKMYDETAAVWRQAWEIEKQKLGEDDLQVAYTLQSIGVCLRDGKQYDEAEELLKQALEI